MTFHARPPGTLEAHPESFGSFPGAAIHIADEQGFLLFTSPVFDRRFGFELGSLVGKHLSLLNDFSPQANGEKIRGIVEQLRIQGFWQGELFNRTADGRRLPYHSRIYPFFIDGCQYWLGVEEEAPALPSPPDPFQNIPEPQAVIRRLIEQWSLLAFPGLEREVPSGLQAIGESTGSNRCALCLWNGKKDQIEKAYEWCAQGTEYEWLPRQGSPLDRISMLKDWLKAIAACSPFSPQENGIEKILIPFEETWRIPLYSQKTLAGLMVLEGPMTKRWGSAETIGELKRLGEIVLASWEGEKAEQTLQEMKDRYPNILPHMNDVVFSINSGGLFTYVSPAVEGILGYKSKEMLGEPLARFIHPRDLDDYRRSLEGWLQGNLHSPTLRLLDHKKNIRHIHISCRRILRGGQPAGAAGILRDVTHQKWTQALQLRAEKKYRHIFENAVDGIYQRTFDGRFITANPACARIMGCASPSELTVLTPDPDRPFYGNAERQAEFQRLLQELGMAQEFEYPFRRKDNQKIWISESAQAVRDAFGEVLFYEGTMKDITERKAAEERVNFLSFHDCVTGLYNRAFFEEELNRLNTARQLPLSVIIGDVNSLKLMNDSFGHSEGDRLLTQIAAILKECCRKEDVIARLGGDEFAILLPRTNRRSTVEIIERIQSACRNLSRNTPPVSIALGAATKEEHFQDIHQITKEAEDHMYREKLSTGRKHKAAIIEYLRYSLSHQCQETEDHMVRSQRLALPVGRAFGLAGTLMDDLALLAELHDIGKIAIPPEILNKAGSLSPSEWEAVRKHPEIGGRIASSIPELASVADAVLSHHEQWNGPGYPRGLKEKEIPLLARIFSIVDAYEVMTRGRPHKPPLSHAAALEEIKREAGSQFDPELADLVAKRVWAEAPIV